MAWYDMVIAPFISPYNSNNAAIGAGGYSALDTNYLNASANQVYNQQQALWEREDSAYQRMVTDMKKAGLNPWTGISSGGLSASADTPASKALDSLIQTMSYNLEAMYKQNKFDNDWFNSVTKFIAAVNPMW